MNKSFQKIKESIFSMSLQEKNVTIKKENPSSFLNWSEILKPGIWLKKIFGYSLYNSS